MLQKAVGKHNAEENKNKTYIRRDRNGFCRGLGSEMPFSFPSINEAKPETNRGNLGSQRPQECRWPGWGRIHLLRPAGPGAHRGEFSKPDG